MVTSIQVEVMDKISFVPTMHTLKDFVNECKCIERTEMLTNYNNEDDSDDNKKDKTVRKT